MGNTVIKTRAFGYWSDRNLTGTTGPASPCVSLQGEALEEAAARLGYELSPKEALTGSPIAPLSLTVK